MFSIDFQEVQECTGTTVFDNQQVLVFFFRTQTSRQYICLPRGVPFIFQDLMSTVHKKCLQPSLTFLRNAMKRHKGITNAVTV